MKPTYFIYIFFFLFSLGLTQAQVRFETKVSKSKLGVNERLRVDFEMNQDGDNFNPPSFSGFRVVGGPNQAISNSYINGKRSYSKTYSYYLTPQKRGKFAIGQATIDIDGETYKTLPVSIEVTAAVERPKDGDNAEYVASENVHLVASISDTNPYLNEAITVQYRLYVSNDVNLTRGFREIDTPKYADFWSQTISNRGNFTVYDGEYNGRTDYRYIIVQTTVLYPQKTGKLTIEPLTLDVPIDVETNKRDLFGRRLMTRVNKTISAGNKTIDVKPLPAEGRPDNFNGAVGDFTFDVQADRSSLDANEALQLTVKVSGKGNLKLFDLPSVKLPAALELFEPERDNKVSTQTDGMRGSISETYTVVPQFKGDYPIRPLSFSFFDPKTEKYRTLSSDEIVLNVVNGPVTSATTSETTTNGKNPVTVFNEEQFKYIKLNTTLKPVVTSDFFQSGLFWSLVGGPFLLIPLFIFIGRKRKKRLRDIQGNKLRRADKLAKKYLTEAKRSLGDKVGFYEAMERALHNYLKAKLAIETSDFSKEKITGLLHDKGAEETTIATFFEILKSCELARYTPASSVAMKHDYDKAVKVISTIDKQLIR
ncbi:MAG: protein BatD [Flavobacteriaceae bacterium]|nr:protein BatD [Flavobacteriaceae bacterium]